MKNCMLVFGITSTMVFAASCNKDENGDYVCTCKNQDGDIESSTAIVNQNLINAQGAYSDKEDQLNDRPLDPDTYICRID
jgi:hypothetical protein